MPKYCRTNLKIKDFIDSLFQIFYFIISLTVRFKNYLFLKVKYPKNNQPVDFIFNSFDYFLFFKIDIIINEICNIFRRNGRNNSSNRYKN